MLIEEEILGGDAPNYAGCHWIVSFSCKDKIFDNIEEIPYNRIGLLLATSPFTTEGWRNLYYENRIKATVQLYKNKKVDYIIVSGGGLFKRRRL